jgi:uncharacterized protein (TIGR02246 family)
MRSRILLGVLVLTAGLIYAFATAQNRASAVANDVQAVQKAIDAYTAAFNKGDLDAILAIWSMNAEYIDETGKSIKGRDALGELFKKVLKESQGSKLQIKTSALRFVKDDVALQDGTAMVTSASGETETSSFSAVWTKTDGQWLLSLVRDSTAQPAAADSEPTPAKLKDLSWLIGTWNHEDKQLKTALAARWMTGENYLVLEYTIQHKEGDGHVMSLMQMVGWNPITEQLHSWIFDSRGGFGEGSWTRHENTWSIEAAGITAAGYHGSGTHKYTRIDANAFTFEALDRNLDGQPLPDVKITYQRTSKTK